MREAVVQATALDGLPDGRDILTYLFQSIHVSVMVLLLPFEDYVRGRTDFHLSLADASQHPAVTLHCIGAFLGPHGRTSFDVGLYGASGHFVESINDLLKFPLQSLLQFAFASSRGPAGAVLLVPLVFSSL